MSARRLHTVVIGLNARAFAASNSALLREERPCRDAFGDFFRLIGTCRLWAQTDAHKQTWYTFALHDMSTLWAPKHKATIEQMNNWKESQSRTEKKTSLIQ